MSEHGESLARGVDAAAEALQDMEGRYHEVSEERDGLRRKVAALDHTLNQLSSLLTGIGKALGAGDGSWTELVNAAARVKAERQIADDECTEAKAQRDKAIKERNRLVVERNELLETVEELVCHETLAQPSTPAQFSHFSMGCYEDAMELLVRMLPDRWVATPTGMERIEEPPGHG